LRPATLDPAIGARVERRKLLTGGLSAPLVFTVTPALGVAQTTFMACLRRGDALPVGAVAPPAHAPPDEWLRIDLDILEIRLPNAKGELVAQPGRFFVGSDRITLFRLADVRPESAPATPVGAFNAATLGIQTRVVEKRRALAYVNRDGEIVGYAWQPRGGAHITASCYASVLGGARKRLPV
jgi:hypothetical protein